MEKWRNQQNKQHFALFAAGDVFNDRAANMGWSGESFFYNNSDKLNKRLGRISPRRGRKEVERIVNELYENEAMNLDIIMEISELIESEDNFDHP